MERYRDPDKDQLLNDAVTFEPTILTAKNFPEIRERLENAFTQAEFQTIILENVKGLLGRLKTAFYRKPNIQIANLPTAGGKGIGFSPPAFNF